MSVSNLRNTSRNSGVSTSAEPSQKRKRDYETQKAAKTSKSFFSNGANVGPKSEIFSFLRTQELTLLSASCKDLHRQINKEMPRVWQHLGKSYKLPDVYWPDFSKGRVLANFNILKRVNDMLRLISGPKNPFVKDLKKLSGLSDKQLVCKFEDPHESFIKHTLFVVNAIRQTHLQCEDKEKEGSCAASSFDAYCRVNGPHKPAQFLEIFRAGGEVLTGQILLRSLEYRSGSCADSTAQLWKKARSWIAEKVSPDPKTFKAIYEKNPDHFHEDIQPAFERSGYRIDAETFDSCIYHHWNRWSSQTDSILGLMKLVGEKEVIFDSCVRFLQILFQDNWQGPREIDRVNNYGEIVNALKRFEFGVSPEKLTLEHLDALCAKKLTYRRGEETLPLYFYRAACTKNEALVEALHHLGLRPNNGADRHNSLTIALRNRVPREVISCLIRWGAKPSDETMGLIESYSSNLEMQQNLRAELRLAGGFVLQEALEEPSPVESLGLGEFPPLEDAPAIGSLFGESLMDTSMDSGQYGF